MTREELFRLGSHYQVARREDIAGIDSTLEYVDTIIYWLRNASKFTERESRLEPGLLFEGKPGTGKTLCARYIASVSNALFVNVRDWPIDGDVITAKDISDLFRMARHNYTKSNRPVILFWDEFEGYAQDRQTPSNSLRQSSVVSQLTAEMDGIHGKCEGILLIGCTNFKDSIDSALLRPGRMGLHIRFNSPDRAGKSKLLKHYLSKFNVDKDFDYEGAAYFFETSDTAATVEEAAQKVWLRAIIDGVKNDTDPIITNQLANTALLDRLLGPPPPFMDLKEDTYFRVAVHELGHALAAKALGIPVQIVTIQPGENSFGRTYLEQPYDKIATVDDIKSQIASLLGSAFSEECMELARSAAVRHDASTATKLSMELANSSGNDSLIAYEGWEGRARLIPNMSEDMLRYYDMRGRLIFTQAESVAQHAIQSEGKEVIETLANLLVSNKTWTGPQFEKAYNDVRSS